jgi:probable rRNA maturation factor
MAKKKSTQVLLPSLTNEISFNIVDVSYTLRSKTKLKDWVVSTIKKEKRIAGTISYNLCSDKYLLKMNQEHLKHDYYTDIITFDFCEGSIVSGDIYISLDRVRDNADGSGMLKELYRVIIHGVLHLCGYKDKKPQDAKQMRAKEDYYLSLLSK